MIDRVSLILTELKRRDTGPKFRLEDFCFKEQLDFIKDQAQYKTAVCSRRAGKTIACAADLIHTALTHPDVVCLYVTLRRNNAMRLVWPELKRINTDFNLGGDPNETYLSLTFPNRSVIYCSGAKDRNEIENFRGLPLKKVYVDECQSFRAYIEDLIDDVLSKALFDYAGTLCLIGTPGLVPAGYFYNQTQSKAYRHHFWTMFQNPHLERKSGKTVQALVDADCERMGVTLSHPKIQRECYGRWVIDYESLVFSYEEVKNDYKELPDWRSKKNTVIGVDLGFEDADAIAVIGWHEHERTSYLIEEKLTRKQGITELADQIGEMIKKHNPIKIVMDTGGLGKKIAEEITARFGIPVEAAEKTRKIEFIELLNDAMRTGRFKAKKSSAFAQDCMKVEWDFDKTTPDKKVISDNYHSDICDAVLYAYREALHWLSEPVAPRPKPGTPEHYQEQEDEMEIRAEQDYLESISDDFTLTSLDID
jgi:hypothetical protein